MSSLHQVDPEVYNAIELEKKRQQTTVNLIASENYASKAVLEALGSYLTDKYAEGYPHKRHYGGCENVDTIETLAIERVKQLFHADHANVQPHAGAQANMAAYFATVQPGDTIMGMKLAHGGHLTHGDQASFSGRMYNFIPYGVSKETERIDYQEVERLALEHKPKLIVVGASAYPRIIDFERFRQIADMVGAKVMVDIAHIAGLIAVGLHPTPVPYAEIITSTTHKTLRGPRGAFILCRADLAKSVDSAVFPRMQGGPLMHAIAARAVAFQEALQPSFMDYQRNTLDNAQVLAAELKQLGLRIVSGGTDNHMVLVDLTPINVSGKQAQEALERVGIVVNRNSIPFDTRSNWVTSGIRLGSPAMTTRGFTIAEMKLCANLIFKVLTHIGDKAVENQAGDEVQQWCHCFPIPGIDD
ncbi:MAG: serine hydroxymethyltransferase [Dehalococcoidales bacterium]|nr:serine hydroxymethyltransferase [Dehalococcoidales bacterium]